MKQILALLLCLNFIFAAEVSDEFENEFNAQQTFDPLSGYNRVMTGFNDTLYTYIFNPVARGYRYVMPEPGRTAIGNFFDNLMYPIRLVNNLLQFKFKNAGEETLRFVANTIVGFGGISDVATKYYNLPRHDEDFGQTLGAWGIGAGPHIVWPIFGPSNLRDTFGMVGDFFTNPVSYVEPSEASFGAKTINQLNQTDPDFYENLKKEAVDLYPFLRDAYEQRRYHLIKE
ncbi:MAG: VacJ family lipoprotein [Campylobacter sp.]|nr:VacJ family lipoprotein [Campylobacter sp.]